MDNDSNGSNIIYNNNKGLNCQPLYKKEFLPHGLCHFYLRHGYCKNRTNCRWDHPPLGDRPDYRYVNNNNNNNNKLWIFCNGYFIISFVLWSHQINELMNESMNE